MAELTVEFFLDLETQVWDALVKGDPQADSKLLASDFLGVYPTGFADRAEHVGQLAGGPTAAAYSLSQAVIRVISDTQVLLSYRADWQPIKTGEIGEAEAMYISSLWSVVSGEWINTFSQDTPALR